MRVETTTAETMQPSRIVISYSCEICEIKERRNFGVKQQSPRTQYAKKRIGVTLARKAALMSARELDESTPRTS